MTSNDTQMNRETKMPTKNSLAPNMGKLVGSSAQRAVTEVLDTVNDLEGIAKDDAARQDPVPAVQAARLLRDELKRLSATWIQEGRAAGATWADFAEAFDGNQEAAFAFVAGGSWGSLEWTCTTCKLRVRDDGPGEADVRARERGHAVDCARFLSEIDHQAGRGQD